MTNVTKIGEVLVTFLIEAPIRGISELACFLSHLSPPRAKPFPVNKSVGALVDFPREGKSQSVGGALTWAHAPDAKAQTASASWCAWPMLLA